MSRELQSGALPGGSARGGVDTRDMLEVHKVVRREFTLAPGLVRATGAGDSARAHTLAAHLELLISLLQVHHAEEDRQLWPKLLERVPERIAPIVSQMESQHQHIHQATESVLARLPRWSSTAAAKSAMNSPRCWTG